MKNNKRSHETERGNDIRSQFESLPLEDKFSNLFKMEVATITEAINYVTKDPMNVLEKIGDAVKEVGSRIESELRSAASGWKSGEKAQADPKASGGSSRRRSSPKPASPAA